MIWQNNQGESLEGLKAGEISLLREGIRDPSKMKYRHNSLFDKKQILSFQGGGHYVKIHHARSSEQMAHQNVC